MPKKTIKAEIVDQHPFKRSISTGTYKQVFMKLENGKFCRTYLVPGFRNYNRWKRLNRIGNKIIIRNFRMYDDILNIVDADSTPYLDDGKLVGSGQKWKREEIFKSIDLKDPEQLSKNCL